MSPDRGCRVNRPITLAAAWPAAFFLALSLLWPGTAQATTKATNNATTETTTKEDGNPPHVREGGETGHPWHIAVDGTFTYGIGGQSALGGILHGMGYTAVWNTRSATGTLDLGVQLAYQNEPTFLAPWLAGVDVQGATHRINAFVTAGHTVHLGELRRASLGLHVFGGWSHWISSYTLTYPREGIMRSATVDRADFAAGGEFRFAYRFSRSVGMHVMGGAPLPFPSNYVVGMFFVGIGVTYFAK